MKTKWIMSGLFVAAAFIGQMAFASSTANLRGGVILKGRDPVSYFQAGGPKRGSSTITVVEGGIKYLFVSEQNRQEFLNNPSMYRPEYEGWCATAVAGNYKYDIDPEAYVITDNRLFVFYKGFGGDTRKEWMANEPANIQRADRNWPAVRLLPNP